MQEYLPATKLMFLFALFGIARFENQRWIRARARGLRGANELFGAFVDLTGILSLLFVLAFLIAHWYDASLIKTIVLFIISVASITIYSLISTIIFRGDNPIVWFAGTIAVWAILLFLVPQITWFGLL